MCFIKFLLLFYDIVIGPTLQSSASSNFQERKNKYNTRSSTDKAYIPPIDIITNTDFQIALMYLQLV